MFLQMIPQPTYSYSKIRTSNKAYALQHCGCSLKSTTRGLMLHFL